MKFTVLLALVAFVVLQAEYLEAEEFVCQPDVPYIENECNGCFCGPTNRMSCTLKACSGPNDHKLYNCEVGTTYDKGCNKCWCVEKLGTICTNRPC